MPNRSNSARRSDEDSKEAPSSTSLSLEIDREMEQMRRLSLPANHIVNLAKPRPSIVDIAEECGLLDLSSSDLVCDTDKDRPGFRNYHCVVSSTFHSNGSATIFLAKFDSNTNLEALDSTKIPAKTFEEFTYPQTELAMAVLGLLLYRNDVYDKRVLCLLRATTPHEEDFSAALEPLKKAAAKLRVTHHVQFAPPKEKKENVRLAVNAGMRMRVMLCQSRTVEDAPPKKVMYEAKAIVDQVWNPFYCMCLSVSSLLS